MVALLLSLILLSLIQPISISYITLLGIVIFSVGYFGLYISIINKNILIYIITILFGLIHGYGFGSFLIKTEIENHNLIYGLVGFNIGVEIGQLIFVSLIIILLKFMNVLKLNNLELLFKNIIFLLIISFGFFWFITRILA